MAIVEKEEKLKEYLKGLGSVAVAFSGGVDSTYLLKTAHDALGNSAVAITARSCAFPKRELDEAIAFCKKESISHIICDTNELEIEGFSANPANRCYICKREIFRKMLDMAQNNNIEHLAEGSNTDDDGDYRPGMIAVKELGVKSPLHFAGLAKSEIRVLSQSLNLPTWNKQSFACLYTRFPYGETITREKLAMIDKAEQYLLDLGLSQVRVRCHGALARIETDEHGFEVITKERREICGYFREIGFAYASLDLLGYRTGSMNETLTDDVKL